MTSILHSSKSETKALQVGSQNSLILKLLALVFCFFAFNQLEAQCNRSLDLDANGDFLSVTLEVPESFTFEAWVLTTDTDGTLLEFGTDSPLLGITDDTIQLNTLAVNPVVRGVNINTGTWRHVALTHDDVTNAVLLYVDGELVDVANLDLSSNPVPTTLQIGGDFIGLLDEVRIWNVVRTQGNIQALMNTELTGFNIGLIAYYRFNTSDVLEHDYSQEGNHATASGTPAQSANFPIINNFCNSTLDGTCAISCNDLVQISLDDDCLAVVDVDMVMEGFEADVDVCNLEIFLFNIETGDPIDNPIDHSVINKRIKATVVATGSGSSAINSCWGLIDVEDKIDPVIDCPPDITVTCNDPLIDPEKNTDQHYEVNLEVDSIEQYLILGNHDGTGDTTILYGDYPVPIAPNTANGTDSTLTAYFKFANQASILEVLESIKFDADLRTTSGNWEEDDVKLQFFLYDDQGAPVLDADTNPVEGILSGNNGDFTYTPPAHVSLSAPGYTIKVVIWDPEDEGTGSLYDLEVWLKSESLIDVIVSDNCDDDLEYIFTTGAIEKLNCGGLFSAQQEVNFKVMDDSGNMSNICTFYILYERVLIHTDAFKFPVNIDGLDFDGAGPIPRNPEPLSCDGIFDVAGTPNSQSLFWDFNGDEYPNAWNDKDGDGEFDWTDLNGNGVFDFWVDLNGDGRIQELEFESCESETGVPTINGKPIFPNEGLCEINATFEDVVIPICENSYKILRRWYILDWCTPGEEGFYEHTQIIKVIDNRPPIGTAPVDCEIIAVNAPYECTADYEVPAPISVFECGEWTWKVEYVAGVEPIDGTVHPTDENCGCPDPGDVEGLFTSEGVVYSNGKGYMSGSSTTGTVTINDLPAGCAWIRYVLEDACGNVSTDTRFEVRVVDQTPPIPVCDEHTVVTLSSNCEAKVWAKTFDDGSYDNCDHYDVSFKVRKLPYGQFDDYVTFDHADLHDDVMVEMQVTDSSWNTNSCMVSVRVDDKIPPYWITPAKSLDREFDCGDDLSSAYELEPEAGDNCGVVDFELVRDDDPLTRLNSCGTGILIRQWRATDYGDNSITFTQTITVKAVDYEITDADWKKWLNPSNKFTVDIDILGCVGNDTSPDGKAGKPFAVAPFKPDDNCSLLAYTHEDQVFTFAEDACFKIIRTWTIIDWCQYEPNSSSHEGIWTKTQVIKVYDYVAPEIGDGAECMEEEIISNPDDCSSTVTLTAIVSDNCTHPDDILVSYEVNFEGGASLNGIGDTYHDTDVPAGSHSITWVAEDGCGNTSVKTCYFEVRDEKAPTPLCITNITTVIMPSAGWVDVWAIDFNNGSTDNCCDGKEECEDFLDFTMRREGTFDVLKPSVRFDCDDVGMVDIEMWVSDGYSSDFCSVKVFIQANGSSCPDAGTTTTMVAGVVQNEFSETVEDVMVSIENPALEVKMEYMTKANGQFEFNNVLTNTPYAISAERDDNYLNGVSTFDLVLIQRHILGITPFESAYKLLAADIDNNQNVTAADMVELRQLILGVRDEFQNNQSWRFIDKTQEINDELNPWPFTEIIQLEGIIQADLNNNFVGVKVGDVSGNAKANQYMNIEVREAPETLELATADAAFRNGEYIAVPIAVKSATDMVGMQFTFNMDASAIEYVGIESGSINVSDANLGLHSIENGMISVSWNQSEAVSLNEQEALFTLLFKALKDQRLDHVLSISSDITSAEAYDAEFERMDVTLEIGERIIETSSVIELYQNEPNPFTDQTKIGFYMPTSGVATLNVFDINGKKLLETTDAYDAGRNEVTLFRSQLQSAGVMYYQLDVNGYRLTKKMIFID